MPTAAPSKKDKRGVKPRRQRGDNEPSLLGRMFLIAARSGEYMMTVFGAYTVREYEQARAEHDAKRGADRTRTPAERARWLAEPVEAPCWCGKKTIQVPRDVVISGKTGSHDANYNCHPPRRAKKKRKSDGEEEAKSSH